MPEPNACLVCTRPDVADIDAALDAGEGLNATARRFKLSRGPSSATPSTATPSPRRPLRRPSSRPRTTVTPERLEPGSSNLARAGSNLGMAVVAPAAPPASSPQAPEPPPAAPPSHRAPAPERARPGLARERHRLPWEPRRPGRVCACCSSPRRREIDQRLAAGQGPRAIEAQLAPGGPSAKGRVEIVIPRLTALGGWCRTSRAPRG
jgi:hypothetical protein